MSTATKKASRVKNITPGAKVKKAAKVVSTFKLMLNANKTIKNEVFSLSGAIKNFNSLPDNDKFLTAAKIDKKTVNPVFVLKNIVKVPNFKMINNEVFQVVTIKGVKTDKLKTKWSHYQVLQSIYYSL